MPTFHVMHLALEPWAFHFMPMATAPRPLPEFELPAGVKPDELFISNRVSPERGHRDLLGTTEFGISIVSQRFVDLLEAHGFSGWTTRSVYLLDRTGEHLPAYSILEVTGRAGPLDRSRNRMVVDPIPPPFGPHYLEIGAHFDFATWDGSDLFIPAETYAICVVDRVKQAVQEAGLTNVRFDTTDEFVLGRHGDPPRDLPPGVI